MKERHLAIFLINETTRKTCQISYMASPKSGKERGFSLEGFPNVLLLLTEGEMNGFATWQELLDFAEDILMQYQDMFRQPEPQPEIEDEEETKEEPEEEPEQESKYQWEPPKPKPKVIPAHVTRMIRTKNRWRSKWIGRLPEEETEERSSSFKQRAPKGTKCTSVKWLAAKDIAEEQEEDEGSLVIGREAAILYASDVDFIYYSLNHLMQQQEWKWRAELEEE